VCSLLLPPTRSHIACCAPLSHTPLVQVLVDPSCSGSGMRHEHSAVIEESGVGALVQLQTSVLRHALAFPKATRVVYRCASHAAAAAEGGRSRDSCYSTCSHYEAENEGVVNAVGRCASRWPFDLV
jgi:16S rRNA C967 or C1407 C5-methylase (RsmB/RsmF family)